MGYRLAKAATLNNDPPLSDRARLVLIRMAWVALDKSAGDQPAAEYWGGWEYLTLPWDDGTRTPDAVKRLAMRALAELATKGYIKPTGTAHLGRRQRYALMLND